MSRVSVSLLVACAAAAAGCSGRASGDADDAPANSGAAPAAALTVPVHVDSVRRENLNVIVTAPGRTAALRQDRIRAPFASRVVSLRVTDGDRVAAGDTVAEVVSKNSEAALAGARQMLGAARTAQDSADARRAIELARGNLVRQALRAPADGVVLSHGAQQGDYVDESEVLVTIAEAGAVFFEADVTQSDLDRIRPGQRATIAMPAAGSTPVGAVVHGVLPSASSQNLSAPVRLDFSPRRPEVSLGLFGTASIIVGQHAGATVVPASAVLRDDVSGVSRVAVVDSAGAAHWLVVDPGIREGNVVEIVHPSIAPGTRVVTDGQVGLPEGAKVRVES
jgi:RND family efflux transporter MFP subunit